MDQQNKRFTYDASGSGACCTRIHICLAGETIVDAQIEDGCDGNHRGIESLVKGRPAREVIQLLLGTDCEGRGTSCPDQLARALQAALRA